MRHLSYYPSGAGAFHKLILRGNVELILRYAVPDWWWGIFAIAHLRHWLPPQDLSHSNHKRHASVKHLRPEGGAVPSQGVTPAFWQRTSDHRRCGGLWFQRMGNEIQCTLGWSMSLRKFFSHPWKLINVTDVAGFSLIYPLLLRDLSQLSAPHVCSFKLSEMTRAWQTAFCLSSPCRAKLAGSYKTTWEFWIFPVVLVFTWERNPAMLFATASSRYPSCKIHHIPNPQLFALESELFLIVPDNNSVFHSSRW